MKIKLKPQLLDKEDSSLIISENDEYLKNFSTFDFHSRLNTSGEVTHKDLLEFLSYQTLDWNEKEKEKINKIFRELEPAYKSYFNDILPEIVSLIKTTGQEEYEAAYTRKNNIYLPLTMVRWPYNELKEMIAHELFHVVSNNNPELRNRWYAKLGFIACPELQIPNEYQDLYVSNPDTIGKNCYLLLQENGETAKAVSFLYSERPYTGGYFFHYFRFTFLIAKMKNGKCIPLYEGDQLKFIDVPQSLYDLCIEIDPYNNQHRLHPEEILAYYWSLLPFSETELEYNKRSFFRKIHSKIRSD